MSPGQSFVDQMLDENRMLAEQELGRLLLSLFSMDELRRRLVQLSGGDALNGEISWSGPPAQVTLDVVETLKRHGLLDRAFFDAMVQARPRRAAEIERVAQLFAGPPSAEIERIGQLFAEAPAAAERSSAARSVTPAQRKPRPISAIFPSNGPPDLNLVAPAQLHDLNVRLAFMGEGLVIDGPSGVGKSTAARLALATTFREPVEALIAHGRVQWIESKSTSDRARLDAIITDGHRKLEGYLVIDDFHLLDRELQGRVAYLMKSVADVGTRAAKIVVIGINPAGMSLVRGFTDLAGRFHVISMGRQPDEKIDELIRKGEAAANIRFQQRAAIVREARGSFFTAQVLCQELALHDRIYSTASKLHTVFAGPDDVRARVLQKLKFKFHEPLLTLVSYGKTAPARGATFALLWLLGDAYRRTDDPDHDSAYDGSATLIGARRNFPAIADEIDWLISSNLAALFAREPSLAQIFFYNRDGGVLSAEDPQLGFYLANLSWPALARDAGLQIPAHGDQGRPIFADDHASAAVVTPRAEALPPLPRSTLLHLSDLHVQTKRDAELWADQLISDLRTELKRTRLDAIIVSGDIACRATAEEYVAAALLLETLRDEYKLSPTQIILVPGNHDLNWVYSEQSYQVRRRKDVLGELVPAETIDRGEYVEIADPVARRERFRPFADFYFNVRAETWPLDYDQQATLHHLPAQRLLVLGLNSSWNIDHAHRDLADIHDVALARALQRVRREESFADCLKIAVWHHPVQSPDDDRLRDTGFVERLAQAGFRLGLHGHIHKPQPGLFRYDLSSGGRRLDLVGAGTFGAPVREWQPGYPLQYQLLDIEGSRVTVRSRRREELNGAWKPDARWTQGPGEEPRSAYEIQI